MHVPTRRWCRHSRRISNFAAPKRKPRHMTSTLMTRLAILGMGVVTAFATLEYAQDFFAPVLSALILGIVLSPLVRFWERIGLRPSLSAFATVAITMIAVVCLVLLLEPYVAEAIARAPVIWVELRTTIEGIRAMILGLDEIAEDVVAAVDPKGEQAQPPAEGIDVPSITDALFYAPQFLAQLMMFVGVLYFFLLTRTEIYRWIGASVPTLSRDDFLHAERQVSRYFLTITAINGSFGVAIAVVMQLIGMPGAVFWGVSAFFLNYILYLGPLALGATLLVAGMVVFNGAASFAPAAIYLSMNAVEGQFVTPAMVGKRMSVNTLLVFVSLVFWLWLWGPIGGVIAIPLLIWMITITERALGQPISDGIPNLIRTNPDQSKL
jgi:predicted PurR-regulated permease PerM